MSEINNLFYRLRRFNQSRLLRLYGKSHDALIGEWIHWWNNDVLKGSKRIVHSTINPAMRASFRGKRYFADILFAEHIENQDVTIDREGTEREFYRIMGVAEVENTNSTEKLNHRINSLFAYEKCRDKRRNIKFEDLTFAVLCTFFDEYDFENKQKILDLIDCVKNKSADSNLYWVLCVLQKGVLTEDDDYFFRVAGYAKDRLRKTFYYQHSFVGSPQWHFFHKGRKLRNQIG